MKLVTVIIPVYKTQEYLKKCVSSVLEQSYRNIEIILVDDGSPDKSDIICDELCKADCRIKVVHQKNQGLSGARNFALDIAQGEYITFVDSDDTICENMIEWLVEDSEEYNADIVECQFFDVFNKTVKEYKYFDEKIICKTEKAILIDLSGRGGSVTACGKLYNKNIFKTHRFEIGKLGEDTYALIGSLKNASRIIIDNRPMYYYYHRKNSITTNAFNEKMLDAIKGAERNLKIVKMEYPGAMEGALYRYDWSHLWVLDRILLDDNWRKNVHLKYILKHIRKNILRVWKSPYFTHNRKIGAGIAAITPMGYRLIVVCVWKRRWN